MFSVEQFKYNLPIIFVVLLFSTTVLSAQINSGNTQVSSTLSNTSVSADTIPALPYSFQSDQRGGLFLNDNKELEVIYDPNTGNYILMEKIGDYYIEHPRQMTAEEYKDYRLQRDMIEYSRSKLDAPLVSTSNEMSKVAVAPAATLIGVAVFNVKLLALDRLDAATPDTLS